jgi:squalene-hopene/tetraprenyl-beta-curcumene cyclase
VAVAPAIDQAAATLERAVDHLLALQTPGGWWKGELQTNVTMDAEDLLLRHFLGIRTDEETRLAANWIRSQQRADGTWANFYGGPGELSTTVEAYAALRLAGDPADSEHLRHAREWIRDSGGLERTRVFTRLWFSLVGLWSWRDVPVIPPELVFLPPWAPLNLYDFACWARQTVAALAVVSHYRPVRHVGFSLDELRTGGPPGARDVGAWGPFFHGLNRALHRYERRRIAPLRRIALARLERWILERQEEDGSWGGIQPPWVYSLIALALRGYPLDHPVIRRGLTGLDGFTIVEGDIRRLEACQSPVWDTALAVIALAEAGLPPTHEALVQAGDWLVREEVRQVGDWAVRRPRLDPGGWAFEFANDNYPDIDDTAEVVMALQRTEAAGVDEAAERGIRWTLGMVSSDGGWGAFDADNARKLCRKLPFCDFGEVIDPPSADVTAHVVEMLARGGKATHAAARRGVDWLLEAQEPDGSWFGRWGANHVYGTGAAVPALVEAGLPAGHRAIRRAVAWLEQVQNADGGWGEDLRSYDDPAWRGRGASTASQTAWALLALHAAEEQGEAVERGLRWLAEAQRPDGSWDEPWYTGTGFPGAFYINYHLYRIVFPVMALGRYVGSAG